MYEAERSDRETGAREEDRTEVVEPYVVEVVRKRGVEEVWCLTVTGASALSLTAAVVVAAGGDEAVSADTVVVGMLPLLPLLAAPAGSTLIKNTRPLAAAALAAAAEGEDGAE